MHSISEFSKKIAAQQARERVRRNFAALTTSERVAVAKEREEKLFRCAGNGKSWKFRLSAMVSCNDREVMDLVRLDRVGGEV